MRTSTRWAIVGLAVALALIAGMVAELRRSPPPTATGTLPAERHHDGADLSAARQRADLSPCPAGDPAREGPGALRGVVVECAADGSPVDAARAVAGRRVVLNLWASWCAPCREELPAMAEYQRRAGSEALVVTVHQGTDEGAALALLTQLGVRLPTLQDGSHRIAAALRVPNVMPATVVLAADGSVARILPRAFTDAGEIAAAVDDQQH